MRTLLLSLFSVLAGASLVCGAPTLEARVGYGPGLFAPARPVPVRVSVKLGQGEPAFRGLLVLEAWQEEGGAPRCVHAFEEVELGPGSSKTYLLAFRADRSKGVRLRLVDDKRAVQAEADFEYGVDIDELPPGVPLVGTLRASEGRTALYWPATFARVDAEGGPPTGAVALELSPELLAPGGLGGLDALVIGEGQSLEPEPLRALRAWVLEGGQLMVSPGLRSLDQDHPLSPLLPLVARSQRRVRGALAEFETEGEGDAGVVTGELKPGAWVGRAAPDGTPVLVTHCLGRGRVSLLAVSLRDPALGSEEVRAGVFRLAFALSELRPRGAPRVDVLEQSALHADLSGARAEVDRSWIGVLIVCFLVVVGPVDYLIWRWRPGPRTTWITLTLSSLGFSALAFVVGTSGTGPGLAMSSTWIVDSYADGTCAVDGLVVFAGRHRASFQIELAEGLRAYPSGTPDTAPARLQGDLLFDPARVRFNLGLGAALPLRVRGLAAQALPPPVSVTRLGPDRIRVTNHGSTRRRVFVVTREGQRRHQLLEASAGPLEIDLLEVSRESYGTLLDGEGLALGQHAGRELWPTCAHRFADPGAGMGRGLSFTGSAEAVGWGIDRSQWLERGHVVLIVEVEGAPGLLTSTDLPSELSRGVTYFRFHLRPSQELEPEARTKSPPSQSSAGEGSDPQPATKSNESPPEVAPSGSPEPAQSPGASRTPTPLQPGERSQ